MQLILLNVCSLLVKYLANQNTHNFYNSFYLFIREEPSPVTSVINEKWKEILNTEGKILRRVSENFVSVAFFYSSVIIACVFCIIR